MNHIIIVVTMIEWKIDNTLVNYSNALNFMENRVNLIHNNVASEVVWLLEHPSIYTAGTSAKIKDLLANNLLPIFKTGRGGQYTYHGPGQRVVYVMLNLKHRNLCNIRLYLYKLAQCIINTLSYFNVECRFDYKDIGIWVGNEKQKEKIAAFGIRIRKWITYHGVAVNIFPDLSYYNGIVPCGLHDYKVTSLEKLGFNISLTQFDNIFKKEFCKIFSLHVTNSLIDSI